MLLTFGKIPTYDVLKEIYVSEHPDRKKPVPAKTTDLRAGSKLHK
jgi:hypothetical protein